MIVKLVRILALQMRMEMRNSIASEDLKEFQGATWKLGLFIIVVSFVI